MFRYFSPFFQPVFRTFLLIFPFLATALYVASFYLAYPSSSFAHWALMVGSAAAVSWIFFGLLLRWVGQLPFNEISQVCLKVMFRGNLVLLFSVGLNLVPVVESPKTILFLHGLVLLTSNMVMAKTFRTALQKDRHRSFPSLLYWNIGLNGVFACIFLFLTIFSKTL